MNIVFAGTPAFALLSLSALAASKHQLQAVYTQPDRPAGRGRQLQASPVKEWAETHHIPVYQPLNFKEDATIDALAALEPDLIVVIAYGLLLPKKVLTLPRLGCINVHASLLPRWRGASPIQQAIWHGDKETGITIMQMDEGLDTGDMLTKAHCPIHPRDTAGELHDRLSALAVAPLLTTLEALAHGQASPEKQETHLATLAPKITKPDAKIDWNQSAEDIDRHIRALNPWPIAHTTHQGLPLRIYEAYPLLETHKDTPGTILALDKNGLLVATGNGALLIKRLQCPGGKAMSITDWLSGIKVATYLGSQLQ